MRLDLISNRIFYVYMSDKFIDIDKVINEKNPKLKKWIPKFVVRYLKRILHQNEINTILEENKDIHDYDFCVNILERFNDQTQLVGSENIPLSGGAIFVVNHPLGGLDALAIVNEIAPVRKDIKFVVNDILLNLKNISGLFVGVNKHGTNSKEDLLKLSKTFDSEQAVFVFPAGLVSRRSKGIVRDLAWKKTFIVRAKKFKKNVIPVHIDGELSSFFYNLSNIRKALGIKANIEMLYLANETFKLQNKKFTITIGKPINYTTFDSSKSDQEWANEVKNMVYKLND